MVSLLHSVPKPIKDTTPDPCEIVLKAHFGSNGALFALINSLQGIGKVSQGRYSKRADGSVEQTITISVYELARSYETRPEAPLKERPGIVYLALGQITHQHKVGHTDNLARRLEQLMMEFKENFEVIHVIHCRDRYAREAFIHAELKRRGLHIDREFFTFDDELIEWFKSQPNE